MVRIVKRQIMLSCFSCNFLESANPNQAFSPIRTVQVGIADAFTGRGCMYETVAIIIDANMRDFALGYGKEHQITSLQTLWVDELTATKNVSGGPR